MLSKGARNFQGARTAKEQFGLRYLWQYGRDFGSFAFAALGNQGKIFNFPNQ